jgi:cytochrome c-type biogenesis protein
MEVRVSGGLLGLLIAFVAGLISCLSPCVLPLVPIYITHLGTTGSTADPAVQRRRTLQHALAFIAGFTAVFVLLGISIGLVGAIFQAHLVLLQRASGIVMIAMGLYLVGLVPLPWLLRERTLRGAPVGAGYVRSFSVGTMLSLGWTPCIGPTLGAILTLAATSGTVIRGGFLLFAYSMGLAVPFLLTAMAVAPLQRLLARFKRAGHTVEIVGGVVLIVAGILIFDGLLTRLNSYFQVNGLTPKL